MAAGLPIVAARIGAIEEIMESHDLGLLFRAGDPGSLAEAAGKAAAIPDSERQAKGEQGRAAHAKHYTPDAHLSGLRAIYEHVLKSTRPASGDVT